MSNLIDYSSSNLRSQIEGVMDVAVIWQHCAGYPTYSGDGSACLGTSKYTAQGGINFDRNLIRNNALEGTVELVFLPQTFTAGGDYAGKFTLDELQNYSCAFLNTSALDGYVYYTWDEGWYSGNLKRWPELQPAVSYVYNTCVNRSIPTPSVNPIPTPVRKPGDVDLDNDVDIFDYNLLITDFGSSNSRSDFDVNGIVNYSDYITLMSNFGL